MSPQLDLNALVTGVCDVARQAGEAILAIYNQDFSVAHKQDRSPVTEADLHAHYVVAKGLAALTPAIPILSEEGESTPYSERREWQTFWLVDPLDGTREFIKRNGEFTVNVSLISGASAILGVVYSPVQDTFYYAYEGGGAYKRCRDAPETLIKVRPWAGKYYPGM